MIGPLIAAGASLAGSLLGRSDAKRQEANQREFAQNGIQWKVNDAKKAGIHPLYALGAQTVSYSPVTAGTDFSAIGQNLGRAMDATRTGSQRIDAYTQTVQELQLKRMGLENELLSSQIANIRQAGGNPQFPGDKFLLDGQASSGLVKDGPLKRVNANPGQPSAEPGAITDVGYSRTQRGWQPVPSNDVKQRIEDNIFQEVMHAIRNNIAPNWSSNYFNPPKHVKLAPWQYWAMENGEYVIKNHEWRNQSRPATGYYGR